MSISRYEYEQALLVVREYESMPDGYDYEQRWGYEALCEYNASLNHYDDERCGGNPCDDEVWRECFEDWQSENPDQDPDDFDIRDYLDDDPFSPTYNMVIW